MRSTEGGAARPVAPVPIPAGDLARWLWLVPVLLLVAYLVTMDEGVVSRMGMYVHEAMHDGRHLLAVPCH